MTALLAGCLGAVLLSAGALADFGDPLSGLSAEEMAAFEDGKGDFTEVETVEKGLGPVFNEASCVACHTGPKGAIGGTNQRLESGAFRGQTTSPKGTLFPVRNQEQTSQYPIPPHTLATITQYRVNT